MYPEPKIQSSRKRPRKASVEHNMIWMLFLEHEISVTVVIKELVNSRQKPLFFRQDLIGA